MNYSCQTDSERGELCDIHSHVSDASHIQAMSTHPYLWPAAHRLCTEYGRCSQGWSSNQCKICATSSGEAAKIGPKMSVPMNGSCQADSEGKSCVTFICMFQTSAAFRHFALTHASDLPHKDCAQSRAAARRADPQTSAGSVLLPQGRAPLASVSTAGPPDGAAAPVTWPVECLG